MAGVSRDTMDHDLEDGEISGSDSDSEMGATVHNKSPMTAAPAFSGQSFQSRALPQTVLSATSYRSTVRTADSSDSEPDSDEDAAMWRRKRQKCTNVPQPAPVPTSRFGAPQANTAVPGGRKVNNIWGSVVQEQTQEAVEAELDFLGVDGAISMASRQVETYNYVLARKLMEKEKEEQEPGEVAMLDTQLDEYMKHSGRADEENGGNNFKRKRPVKDRLGPRAEMDIKGRYEITEDDPDDRVIEEIAHRLQEPKKELIERVVKVIGKKKAIELLQETATLEETGGVYTMDGSRRRTPGGVYLNLLKNTPSITSAHLKEIFYDETQKDYKSKKSAQKRRRHVVAKKMKQAINTLNLQEHDDVSRETFASDTNEALESLEDVAEEEGRMEPDAESAIGTEDTPVVYNAADLEVF
ncbi:phosphorylated adapter RNA export protein [Esox lucius]|uniref:Phosphorylated adapter RNA export protein n=1 Tax=Esox lucius TaxID=8010 RepID=A0A3P8YRN1_ESOLU|nr:phosphorylated adapter RNA export protein [Esox lucius]